MLRFRHGFGTLRHSVHSFRRSLSTNKRLNNLTSVAPMVDISTPNFLELLHIISGDRHDYYTEMHHPHAIHQHQDHLDRFIGTPRPNVIVQLGGSDPNLLSSAAKLLQDYGYSEININVGCPSPSVQQGQFGAILMKTPSLVADILNAMEGKVSIPVTIKCRIGVDHLDTSEFFHHFVETLMTCERPPPHLIVHARKCILKGLSPKKNRTIPPLNYQRVYELASLYPDLPISINGGFTTTETIRDALGQVDGCMIGRKVMDSPLFLQEIDRDIYGIPENEIKSPLTVIDEYLGKQVRKEKKKGTQKK
ncbi:tRNA-dihydrouridine synthase [Absidia repens]|uniref:tRNA-dihydrouridine synthase n=1 Tax=Absidia repens TaxID=90262 RepID=A0A1X2IRM9_9FUNG|nr:tRNA-dihydrouridine synthase [Absidia repens]